MIITEVNRGGLAPSFDGDDPALAASPTRLSYRRAFYHLVNVEEHPEVLPLAYDLVTNRLSAAAGGSPDAGAPPAAAGDVAARLQSVLDKLGESRGRFSRPWRGASEDLTRRQVLHYFVQYMPTAFVDGCWLQCGLRVSTAHTDVGASLTGLYQHQVRAFVADPGRHFVADYRSVYGRLGAPLEEVSSHSFAERSDFLEPSIALPIFLLSIAQFTRSYPFEILGLNLAWQFMDLSAFGPDLIRDTCEAYALPLLGDDLGDPQHLERGREMARDAAVRALEGAGRTWARRGRACCAASRSGVEAWTQWFDATRAAAPSGPPDPRQEMIDLLWRKAPHASGYHGSRRLGAKRIDDHLDPKTFDGPAILEALAASPWVKTRQVGQERVAQPPDRIRWAHDGGVHARRAADRPELDRQPSGQGHQRRDDGERHASGAGPRPDRPLDPRGAVRLGPRLGGERVPPAGASVSTASARSGSCTTTS